MDKRLAPLLSALIEQVDIGVVVLDAEFSILNWNRFTSGRSGKDLRQAAGRPFSHAFPEADAERFNCQVGLVRDRHGSGHIRRREFHPLRHEGAFQGVDLHRGLDTTLNLVNSELKYKVEVTEEYDDLPEVKCTPSQINRVVMSPLVNAARTIEQFGRITLRTACNDDWVWTEVENSGTDIRTEALERLCDPVFSTKSLGKGAGLGPSLSHSIEQSRPAAVAT
jgi:hypothetical protein